MCSHDSDCIRASVIVQQKNIVGNAIQDDFKRPLFLSSIAQFCSSSFGRDLVAHIWSVTIKPDLNLERYTSSSAAFRMRARKKHSCDERRG
jgi:hypothetical protein